MKMKKCENCGKTYIPKKGRMKTSRFCGRSCARIGKPTRLGMKNSPSHRSKISKALMGRFAPWLFSERNVNWKGEEASLVAKHAWIKVRAGRPNYCEKCKTTTAKKFEWANISGKYKRDVTDYLRLCSSCHLKFDKRGFKKNHKYYAH